ncbi:MAG: hypothetical protein M1326_10140 [Cyanobacteria bacterium]|nr:hypothetical protein [Cyanobacteriota bacterium]
MEGIIVGNHSGVIKISVSIEYQWLDRFLYLSFFENPIHLTLPGIKKCL